MHLRDLIKRRRVETGRTYAQMLATVAQARADAPRAGIPPLSKYQLSRAVNRRSRSMTRDTVCGLAVAVSASHREVSEAIQLDMGIPLEPVRKCDCDREPDDVMVRIKRADWTSEEYARIVDAAHAAVHAAEDQERHSALRAVAGDCDG